MCDMMDLSRSDRGKDNERAWVKKKDEILNT